MSRDVWDRFADAPGVVTIRLEVGKPTRRMPTLPRRKLERERRHFWARFRDEFGELGRSPASYWDARLGFFGVPPGELAMGDLTPEQILQTADLFSAMHGAGD